MMIKSAILLACLAVAFASEVDFQAEWLKFKSTHNKLYAHEKEESQRFQIFSNNLRKINGHNERHANGMETYRMGVNAFTDLTWSEFSAKYLGYNASLYKPAPVVHTNNSVKDLPETVDWREEGIVNGIKDQAQCGSCWAFATIASVEGAWAQAKGKLVSLSEQNLVDCSYSQGNQGCNGGLPDSAFEYIIKNGGVDTEDSYPYTAVSVDSCQYSASNSGASISSYVDVASRDEDALKNAVAERVVAVAIHAGDGFQNYESGIYTDRWCPGYSFFLNHAVTVVGYGTDHWIVRNSWGTSWGENGYIRFATGRNLCGIATQASYPVV